MEIMKKILNTDLITMKGGNRSIKVLAGGTLLFMLFLGFFIDPLYGLEVQLIICIIIPQALYNNEAKYNGHKLWSILPVKREELVKTRFLTTLIVQLAIFALILLLMLIASALELTLQGAEDASLSAILIKATGMKLSHLVVLTYSIAFAFGLKLSGAALKMNFVKFGFSSDSLGYNKNAKLSFKDIVVLGLVIVALVVLLLLLSGLIPLNSAAALVMTLLIQLAKVADGLMMSAVVLTMGLLSYANSFVRCLVEYDNKEL